LIATTLVELLLLNT